MDQQQLLDVVAPASPVAELVVFHRGDLAVAIHSNGSVTIVRDGDLIACDADAGAEITADELRWLLHTAGPAALDALER